MKKLEIQKPVSELIIADNQEKIVDYINESNGDSTVTVNVISTVGGIQVTGLSLLVIVDDNYKHALTTDLKGTATFSAPRGSRFEVHFPYQTGCEEIRPIIRYAVTNEIEITAAYVPEATSYESFSIHVYKWVGNQHQAFADCVIHVTINGITNDYRTGSDGRFETEIPFGTEYTVSVDQIENMYIYGHTNKWTYVANSLRREKIVNYHDVEVGLFMCCSDGAEYTKDEFIASGRPGGDVVMFKISNAQLALHTSSAPNGNVFGIDLNDVIKATYKVNSLQWAGSQVQFNSCTTNQSSDGFDRTYKIVNEGIERSIPTPAATFCFGKLFNLGGTELNGFLGATVQHLAIVSNEQELNEMLKIVRPDATNNFTTMINANKWTIDQTSATSACSCARSVNSFSTKTATTSVLPFYAF